MTFLVFEQFGFLDIVGPGDVFTIANQQAGKPLYKIQITTPGKHEYINSESGMRVGIDTDFLTIRGPHTLLINGGDGFRKALENTLLIEQLSRLAKRTKRVSSICTGAFLLAEAGLLKKTACDYSLGLCRRITTTISRSRCSIRRTVHQKWKIHNGCR